MKIFELPEIDKILGLDAAKAKNWTNGRTGLVIEPSVRKATGTGTRNLFSVQDLYMFGIAQAFSNAGFAANAIGKLAEGIKPLLEKDIASDAVWTITRDEPGGPFTIRSGEARVSKSILLRHTLGIGKLTASIDAAVSRHKVNQTRRESRDSLE